MARIAMLVMAMLVAGCAEITFQQYPGPARPDADVSIVRLWTARTKNIFVTPGLIVEKIDGVEAGSVGRTSHAYVLPGEHEFQVRFIQVKGYHLLCGALCDAIFNKPKLVKAATLPGHVYTLRYIDDRDGTVVLDDRGPDYDRRCLKVREFSEGTGC